MKVLIVDDDPTNCQLFEIVVNRNGTDADVFTGKPEDLLQRVTYEGYDALLLDLMMPEVGGAEVAPFVRREFPRLRIVMITALSRHLIPKGIADVVDVLLAKPCSPDAIVEALGVR